MIEYSKRDFRKIQISIMTQNRYLYDEETMKIINRIKMFFDKRVYTIPKDIILFRAQKGCKSYDPLPRPYDLKRMYPLEDSAKEGRANPKGIPYLYMATKIETAISEVRSWPGEDISVGTFKNTRDLKMIDFTSDKRCGPVVNFDTYEILSENDIESLWGELNEAFSRPVSSNDNTAEYALTQLVAECVKKAGYDGLIYNSGYSDEEINGKNIVIFDKSSLIPIDVGVYHVDRIKMHFSQATNPIYYGK